MTRPFDDLRAALAELGPRRHPMCVAAAQQRDKSASAGEHRLAALWNAIAVAIAELEDDENALLAAYEPEFRPAGGVTELPGDTP